MTRENGLQKLLIKYGRRLQKLKEQQASFGLHTSPHILTEIEDLEVRIEVLQTELTEMAGNRARSTSKTSSSIFSLPAQGSSRSAIGVLFALLVTGLLLVLLISLPSWDVYSDISFYKYLMTSTATPSFTPTPTLTSISTSTSTSASPPTSTPVPTLKASAPPSIDPPPPPPPNNNDNGDDDDDGDDNDDNDDNDDDDASNDD
ncbi:MAG: hypothetical protein B6243_04620 [Anaerolineaceae bacterium 4572_5.2]|nr:MAG: hypothetical protein B6243_04620 [Anaerolineaceae bacterium 4572_5.2]